MNKSEVVDRLKAGQVNIVFEKVDGTTRQMQATLSENLIPSIVDQEVKEEKAKKKPNDAVIAVWDTHVEGWRSFRWENLRQVDEVTLKNGIK